MCLVQVTHEVTHAKIKRRNASPTVTQPRVAQVVYTRITCATRRKVTHSDESISGMRHQENTSKISVSKIRVTQGDVLLLLECYKLIEQCI